MKRWIGWPLLFLFIQSNLLATENTRIGIINLYAPGLEAGKRLQILDKMEEAIRTNSRLRVVRDPEVAKKLAAQATDEKGAAAGIGKARSLLNEGKAAYLKLALPEARTKLEQAKRQFIANLNRLDDNAEMLQSHLYLGMTLAGLGLDKLAFEEFRNVCLLDPKLEMSSRDYPPNTIKIFEMAAESVRNLDRAGLQIDSEPERANVLINGKLVGVTPISLSLTQGDQYVRLTKIGFRDWYQLVRLDSPFQKIKRTLESREEEERESELVVPVSQEVPADQPFLEALTKKASAMQVDILLLAEFTSDREYILTGQWFDARTQGFSVSQAVRSNESASALIGKAGLLTKNLLAQIDKNGYTIVDAAVTPNLKNQISKPVNTLAPPVEAVQPKRVSKAWYKKWWVWAVVGGLAAGAGAGFVVANRGGSDKIFVDNGGNVP